MHDHERLAATLSTRPARIQDVLTLLGWERRRLAAAVLADPATFVLADRRGGGRRYQVGPRWYSHIGRAAVAVADDQAEQGVLL